MVFLPQSVLAQSQQLSYPEGSSLAPLLSRLPTALGIRREPIESPEQPQVLRSPPMQSFSKLQTVREGSTLAALTTAVPCFHHYLLTFSTIEDCVVHLKGQLESQSGVGMSSWCRLFVDVRRLGEITDSERQLSKSGLASKIRHLLDSSQPTRI
jgi:hypothetical protein